MPGFEQINKQPVARLSSARRRYRSPFFRVPAVIVVILGVILFVRGQDRFEGREIADISIAFEGTDTSISSAEQYRVIARDALGSRYSAVGVRDAIADLYSTAQIAAVTVEAADAANDRVGVRFVIRRKTVAKRVSIALVNGLESGVTEQELLLRVNLLDPGTAINERSLQSNADLIVEYLRDRGFYRAEARFEQKPIAATTDVEVTFRVTPGPQARIEAFDVSIDGADSSQLKSVIRLQPGERFSRAGLARDIESVRDSLRSKDFLAPLINEPRIIFDSETNAITVTLTGSAGPKIVVNVETDKEKIGNSTQNRLLPIKREGTLDYSAIIEGERRLENFYQERGYFFANVVSVCSVNPPLAGDEGVTAAGETSYRCSTLTGTDLTGREVKIDYRVDLNRRLKLVDIRLRGTDQFTIDEILSVLDSQEANILGIIPIFGYGRGYTSQAILDEDAATIRSLLRELGYRQAEVRINQGVSPDGENLIITFIVEQGVPTRVSDVEIRGNIAFSEAELKGQLPEIVGKNFSRARVRNGQRLLAEFYSNRGYYDAKIDFSVDELPTDAVSGENRFKVIYNIENENKPVFINRILVNGNVRTKTEAILRALALENDELLRTADIYTSEQNLYGTDAFERIDIKPQPVGDRADGGRLTDVIVDVQEQKPRLLQYGGGYSTDLGWSGFVDLRHFNLLGNLWQGGSRLRWSQRQQIAQIDFINPRFIRDGKAKFAPLTISIQYQRDSTVTRFFRSAFDRGTFGIVQRVDKNGVPIDEFGNAAGDPTLNRLSFSAETNRTISRRDRSIVFFRYRYEDVRLFNTQSLLISDLLEPDSRIRISGFSTTYVRDTRRNCNIKYSILDIIARGDVGEKCRYNASDPTNGDYFTAEYSGSVPALGANIGFHKFQASYNYYYTFPRLKNTTIAARGILGLASVFSNGNRFPAEYSQLNGLLPISERFFAGGANTLRGFEFESAGPRVVIVPEGEFRNSDGEVVFLDPFTIPFGGNALAVINVEARIPLSKSVRAVPFYDGGNVFKRPRDIFTKPSAAPNDVAGQNAISAWSHTVGLGFRIRTPIGGEFGIDYGFLLNPPTFLIPQGNAPNAFYRLGQGQLHFRFSQAF